LPHRDVIIEVRGEYISGISRFYDQGEGLMAIIDSNGYLEISLKNGSASNFLDVIVGDEIRVKFNKI